MVQKDDNVKNLCTLLDLFATKGVRGIFYGNIARDGEGVSAVGFNAKVCNRPAGLLQKRSNFLSDGSFAIDSENIEFTKIANFQTEVLFFLKVWSGANPVPCVAAALPA